MGLDGVGTVERTLQRVLVPIFILSGMLVAAGFFFPDFVGEVISGSSWLVIALLFFGSGLGYLSVLEASSEDVKSWDPHYLMAVRRLGIRGNFRQFAHIQDSVTFGIPIIALGGFLILQAVASEPTNEAIEGLRAVITEQFGMLFVGTILLATGFCVVLVVWRWGNIKLGGPSAEPAYTYPVYFTMFFTAGIAAGIVFSGPSEALLHYQSPPPFFAVEPESSEAATLGLATALFHWGFSAWSAYLVIGLPIAYYVYEQGAPLRVSAVLTPFLGPENLDSPLGKLVDVLAIFATIGGITTSVALLSNQFLSGINYQWGVSFTITGSILFVTGLAIIFILSAQSGVHRGIRRIAVVNILLFLSFMVLLIAAGPRGAMVELGSTAVATYATNYPTMSAAYQGEWVSAWTIWNWVWWFSWAPFAGLFLAALSRGRRIRTVVLTGMGATGLASIVWFILLGSTAIHFQQTGTRDILGTIAEHEGGVAVAGFPLLEPLPISDLLMFLLLALIIIFMATSADTSTLVIGILGSQADTAPSTATVVFWGILQGIVAIVVLWTGSAELLQGLAVLSGGPFAIIALFAIAGLVMSLRNHDSEAAGVLARTRARLEAWR